MTRLRQYLANHKELSWTIVVILMLFTLFAFSDWYFETRWTGFFSYFTKNGTTWEEHPGKTLWDWMELLIVPIILVLAGYLFSQRQKEWELTTAKEQQELELKIAKEARENELKITQERVEETTLQNYLDKMTELLLEKDLRNSPEDSEVRNIARSRTLTVLRSLNGERKGSVIQFLRESKLIEADKAIIDLRGANLTGADLRWANLIGADLRGANLAGADLQQASLQGAYLQGVDLRGANLEAAMLSEVNLTGATLEGAYLSPTFWEGATLIGTILKGANLEEAYLENVDLSQVVHDHTTQWPDGFIPDTEPVQAFPSVEESQPMPTPYTTPKALSPLADSRAAASPPPMEQVEEAKIGEDSP